MPFLLPEPLIAVAGRIAGKEFSLASVFPRCLSPEARRRADASAGEDFRKAPDGRINRWRLITSPHIAGSAEVWAQTGARHGLAFAFPLLDRRVVEFSLSLPSEFFLRDGFRRLPFRDAMAGVLPEKVRLRHQKYQPFFGRVLDISQGRDRFNARVDAWQQNASVRRTIDLAHLRRVIESFPLG